MREDLRRCANCNVVARHHFSTGPCRGFHEPVNKSLIARAGRAVETAVIFASRVFYRYPEA